MYNSGGEEVKKLTLSQFAYECLMFPSFCFKNILLAHCRTMIAVE